MTIKEITDYLDLCLHPEYQESYDNSGFLLGDPSSECCGVLTALDLTPEVVDEAINLNVNLIATHHPLIFGGVKRITTDTLLGSLIHKLIRNNIAVYAAHTNLDNLKEGVNGLLANILGLENCSILRPMQGQPSTDIGAGMIGSLPFPLPAEACLEQVKACLGLPVLRVGGIVNPVVSRVAICGGSGSFLIDDAVAQKADLYLTGDLKYHDFQHASGLVTLADIGHFESEQHTKELIYSLISKKFCNFACFVSEKGRSFVNYI